MFIQSDELGGVLGINLHCQQTSTKQFRLPKASCVEWLAALQPRLQILKVVSELLILSKLHDVVEVLHMLHHSVQLMEGEWG